MSSTQFVEMYHPLIPSTITSPALVASQAVDERYAKGWLLVDPEATPPTPDTPYYTKEALLSQIQGGAAPVGTALRAALVARSVASAMALPIRPVQARVRFPLGTAGRLVLGTERGRIGALLVNTSPTQSLKVGVGALDSSAAPGSYTDVPVGQELPLSGATPVWAYYPTTADTVLVVTEVAA